MSANPPFQALLEGAPDAMVIIDETGAIRHVNAQTEKLFGYSRDEMLGEQVEILIPERFRAKHPAYRHAFFKSPHPRPMGHAGIELFARRKDGSEFPAEVSLSPMQVEGEAHVIAAIRDGTLRKKGEEKFKRLLEAAPDAIVISNQGGAITLVNRQAEALFGYDRSELLGKPVELLIPQRFRHRHPDHRRDYYREPRTRPMGAGGLNLYGLKKDGQEFPAEISLSPLETEEGLFAITAIRDITERKRAEEARARLTKAEEAVRLRDEFLSIASHELKTPLTALQLQAETIMRLSAKRDLDIASPTLQKKLETMMAAVKKLGKLINQLLDLSRITAGRLSLNKDRVDLGALTRTVAEQFQDEVNRAGSALTLDIEEGVAGCWDALRIEQIITNLVSNAIKYGAGRPAHIKVGRTPEGMALLSVSDQGIGIAQENQARIFERFERLVSERNYGGFGLGLWIVRQIIEAHGGTIRVWSDIGKGSTFTVELPLEGAAAAAAEESAKQPDFVLLVEDDPLLRESFAEVLRDEGFTVVESSNGLDALQVLKSGRRPRVILLDLMMPVMDAWAFRAEQQKDAGIADIPVIVISATQNVEKEASGLGAQAYLEKPVDVDRFLALVRKFTPQP